VNEPDQGERRVHAHGVASSPPRQFDEALFHGQFAFPESDFTAKSTQALLREVSDEVANIQGGIAFAVEVEVKYEKGVPIDQHLVGIEIAVDRSRLWLLHRRAEAFAGV
jgi:hypothetical protein